VTKKLVSAKESYFDTDTGDYYVLNPDGTYALNMVGGATLVSRPIDVTGTGVFGEEADITTTRRKIDLAANPVAVFSWQWFANASETVRWAYVVINATDDTDADNKLNSASTRRVIALGVAGGLPTSGVFLSDGFAAADLISRIDIIAATATAGSGNDFFYEGVAL
jgi:hypothetical protein